MKREEVEEAFDRYGPLVYRRARAILGNEEEARDAMQDVFIKILRDGLPGDGPIAPWLSRVTANLCLNRIRDEKRRRELRVQHLSKDEGVEAGNDRTILVRKLLSEVDERTGMAAICVHVDGMSYAEAADQLGVSKRTVLNLLQRFKERASQFLGRDAEVLGSTP